MPRYTIGMYTHTCTLIMCVHSRVYMHVCKRAQAQVHVCVCMCTYIHIYIYTHIHYVCVCVLMYIYIYIYIHAHVHIYIHIDLYMYMHVYKYTHVYIYPSFLHCIPFSLPFPLAFPPKREATSYHQVRRRRFPGRRHRHRMPGTRALRSAYTQGNM
jgi:hypothetical protein